MNAMTVIYISAAPELMAEREILARLIATLPVTLPWQIVQTPLTNETLDLRALEASELHFLLLGDDIRAPVGLEWYFIRQIHGQARTHAFLKHTQSRTLAGQDFMRHAGLVWRYFETGQGLRGQIQEILIEHLLRHAIRFSLRETEMRQLTNLLEHEKAKQASQVQSNERSSANREAGHSAVILSRERYEPSEGVLIE